VLARTEPRFTPSVADDHEDFLVSAKTLRPYTILFLRQEQSLRDHEELLAVIGRMVVGRRI